MDKLIITAAITGAVHFPTMSQYLPITPNEIVDDALKAYKAGAAIAHIHVRSPENGMPSADVELFREVHTKIKQRCNMIILPTTGGAPDQTATEKLKVVKELQPEMCSFDPAPWNVGVHQLAERYNGRFKFEWEKGLSHMIKNNVTMHMTFQDDLDYAKTFQELNIKPEFEMYELGHISYICWLIQEGLVDKPPHLQYVFGPMVGWMAPSVKHLVLIHDEAKEMLAQVGVHEFTWSVAAGGKWQMPLAATAIAMGAPNIRVGLEDSLYAGKGNLAKSSAEQVEMVKTIARQMSLVPANPDEARQILGLKGMDKVNY